MPEIHLIEGKEFDLYSFWTESTFCINANFPDLSYQIDLPTGTVLLATSIHLVGDFTISEIALWLPRSGEKISFFYVPIPLRNGDRFVAVYLNLGSHKYLLDLRGLNLRRYFPGDFKLCFTISDVKSQDCKLEIKHLLARKVIFVND